MNPHAIAQALVSGDLCEYGRLMGRNDYVPPGAEQDNAALLASIAAPDDPCGGGGVESRHAQSAGSAAPECGRDGVRVAPYPNRVSPSRSSALPASTLSTPTPSTTTSPSPRLGGVGSNSEEVK